MKDALYYIIISLVDNTDAVSIDESTEQDGTINYSIHAAKEDIGKIIGKDGKIIRAIRNIMKIPAIKQNKRIRISIAEQ